MCQKNVLMIPSSLRFSWMGLAFFNVFILKKCSNGTFWKVFEKHDFVDLQGLMIKYYRHTISSWDVIVVD